MKLFYETRYRFYNERIKTPLSFFVLSDIHFSASLPEERLQLCYQEAKRQKPDYILIPGDLIDYQDDLNNPKTLAILTGWLEQLGGLAPVLISFGNHDYYRQPSDPHKRQWDIAFPSVLVNAIHPLKNVHLLNNAAYEDKDVYIFGLTQDENYFQLEQHNNKPSNCFNPGNESKSVLLHILRGLSSEDLHKLPKRKAHIMLAHSPVHMGDGEVLAFLDEFDLIISGHMHNGAVPPGLQDFWRSDKGLVAPGKGILPARARNTIKTGADKNVTCGAITTIHTGKKISFLGAAFPIYTTRIELSKNILYKRRPGITTKYINPKNN